MSKIIMSIIGNDGQIELMEDRVVIQRKGLWNIFKHGLNANKEIPLAAITNINFRNAGVLQFGEIDFSYGGRSQSGGKENAVMFNKKQQPDFLALKEKMFELMQNQQRQR